MSCDGQHVSHVEHLTSLCWKDSASAAGTGGATSGLKTGAVTGLWPQDARGCQQDLVPPCVASVFLWWPGLVNQVQMGPATFVCLIHGQEGLEWTSRICTDKTPAVHGTATVAHCY